MAETPTGIDQTEPKPRGVRNALRALGLGVLVAGGPEAAVASTAEKAEAPAAVIATTDEVQASIRDCVADGKAYRKTWLLERAQAEGVTKAELKVWLGETMKSEDFKDAMSGNLKECRLANLEERERQQEIQLAALDAKIADARAAFAEAGFDLREDDELNVVLYRGDRLAAYFVQVPDPDAEVDPEIGLEPTKWALDFTPLEAYRDELREQTVENEATIEENQSTIEEMQQEIERIWQRIEDRALGKAEAAELSPVKEDTERIAG